ncbi:MAG: methionine--tRNA ligase [Candidatus Zixiibacteriota bacterium]|nr:MAG: methionine--tRNA ligase [candidate division Zixibacteria bacterium]
MAEVKVQRPFYITTPIYYVNDRPHIGHSYTTIAADLLARYHRLNGRDTLLQTGTDEHGTKIAEAAEKAGRQPQQFCDEVVQHFKTAWENLSIHVDNFIRTTDDRHVNAVEKLLMILHEARTDDGEPVIYSGEYEGLYCTGCEKFLTDKELVNGVCPDHKVAPQPVSEKNYFFRLSAYLDRLKNLIETGGLLILPEERRREVLGLFEQGLSDFSISREKVTWGIPLPFDRSQVTYVWIEALSNYITGVGFGDDESQFKKWWCEAEVVHLMAKDILKFHCIFWPAMLLAARLPLPDTIYLHGFFMVDGERMSKSLGNMIDPNDLVRQYGADAARYLLLTQYPFGIDGDIQRSRFTTKYNSDLANNLGNLVSRVAKMITASFNGKLPAPAEGLEEAEELVSEAEKLPETVMGHIRHYRVLGAIDAVMDIVRQSNRFFDTNAPWKLIKDGQLDRAGGVLYTCAEVLRIVAVLSYPVMPNKALEILSVFGLGESDLTLDNAMRFYCLKPGSAVKIKGSVFPRLKDSPGKPAAVKEPGDAPGILDISEFARVRMVVAEVLKAERVEGADKLLKMQIDIGTEKRQIVAGIAQYYTPEEMVGKKIVVVTNLKPVKIRGVESNGMLLAAINGKKLCLVIPEADLPPGAAIS